MIASGVPDTVTALSVELGSISLATWMDALEPSRISWIFLPPLPIIDPHWLAGTISLNVTGGLGAVGDVTVLDKSSSNLSVIILKAL